MPDAEKSYVWFAISRYDARIERYDLVKRTEKRVTIISYGTPSVRAIHAQDDVAFFTEEEAIAHLRRVVESKIKYAKAVLQEWEDRLANPFPVKDRSPAYRNLLLSPTDL